MSSHGFRLSPIVSAIVIGALTACGGHTGALIPAQPAAFSASLIPNAVPPKCKGQKTTAKYASLKQALKTAGGSLCIPAFGTFGGSILYPSANPSVKMKLTSSTTNYKSLPLLGKGTAVFYLQLAISGGTAFGTNLPAGGGLTSKKLKTGKSYTAFGEAAISGISLQFTPCYVVATKGKYGGVIGGLGTLLKGQNVPLAATGFIEIYPGKQASGKC